MSWRRVVKGSGGGDEGGGDEGGESGEAGYSHTNPNPNQSAEPRL